MNVNASAPLWHVIAVLVARLIFAGLFFMAAFFKFSDMNGTAGYIASAGFPFPLFLAWLAAFFETALALCFLTGALFHRGVAAGSALCDLSRLLVPRPRALGGQPDRVRILRGPLHLHGRTTVRRRARAGTAMGARLGADCQSIGGTIGTHPPLALLFRVDPAMRGAGEGRAGKNAELGRGEAEIRCRARSIMASARPPHRSARRHAA